MAATGTGYGVVMDMLSVEVDRTDPVAGDRPGLIVARPAGSLDLTTAPVLRAAVLRCLAEQPCGLVVDLGGLRVGDDLAVAVFRGFARHAAAWPAVPIVLCNAAPAVAALLHRLAIDRQLVVCPDSDAAQAYARASPTPCQVRRWFPATARAISDVRRHVAHICQDWRLSAIAPSAKLVASELFTNAVRYGPQAMIEVFVTRQPRLLCLAVRDGSHRPPRRRGPVGETDPGGRGLLLLDAVGRWGYTPTSDGKVTWATLAIDRPTRSTPARPAPSTG